MSIPLNSLKNEITGDIKKDLEKELHMHYVEKKSPLKPPQNALPNLHLNTENISDTYKTLIKDIQQESVDEFSTVDKLEELLTDKEVFIKHITTLVEKFNTKINANNLDREALKRENIHLINNNLNHPIVGDFCKQINVALNPVQVENAKSESSNVETGAI